MFRTQLRHSLFLFIFLILIVSLYMWGIEGFLVPELTFDIDFIRRLLCFTQNIGIYQTILGVFIASIIFFIYKSLIYKNNSVEKTHLNLNNWGSILPIVLNQYLVILVQCILWAVVFVFGLLFDIFPQGFYMKTFTLGSVIAIINILPICFEMWIKATYPNKLLAIKFVKRIIGGYIIGFVLVSFIWYLPYGKELDSYRIEDFLRYIADNIGREEFWKYAEKFVEEAIEPL